MSAPSQLACGPMPGRIIMCDTHPLCSHEQLSCLLMVYPTSSFFERQPYMPPMSIFLQAPGDPSHEVKSDSDEGAADRVRHIAQVRRDASPDASFLKYFTHRGLTRKFSFIDMALGKYQFVRIISGFYEQILNRAPPTPTLPHHDTAGMSGTIGRRSLIERDLLVTCGQSDDGPISL